VNTSVSVAIKMFVFEALVQVQVSTI